MADVTLREWLVEKSKLNTTILTLAGAKRRDSALETASETVHALFSASQELRIFKKWRRPTFFITPGHYSDNFIIGLNVGECHIIIMCMHACSKKRGRLQNKKIL